MDHVDAIHAIVKARWHVAEFDEPRVSGGIRPDAWIGPSREGEDFEVFAEVGSEPNVLIFHVMPARAKALRRLQQIMKERRKR